MSDGSRLTASRPAGESAAARTASRASTPTCRSCCRGSRPTCRTRTSRTRERAVPVAAARAARLPSVGLCLPVGWPGGWTPGQWGPAGSRRSQPPGNKHSAAATAGLPRVRRTDLTRSHRDVHIQIVKRRRPGQRPLGGSGNIRRMCDKDVQPVKAVSFCYSSVKRVVECAQKYTQNCITILEVNGHGRIGRSVSFSPHIIVLCSQFAPHPHMRRHLKTLCV